MFTDDIELEECTLLWNNCAELSKIFLSGAPVKAHDVTLPAESTIEFNDKKTLYIIKQGILKELYHDSLIINYETGDLVGADALLQNKTTHINTDFAITVDEYDGLELLEHIRADVNKNNAWNQYLMNLVQSYQLLMCYHKKNEVQFQPEIRHYSKGEIIIQQGAQDDEVFTLMSGSAHVFVDNIQVGEIKRDEVFGAIAALTSTPRTATVISDSPCSVLVVENSRFRDLLASRPDTVAKLIEDMARTIISNNKTIVKLSNQD